MPGLASRVRDLAREHLILLLPVLVFAGYFAVWYRIGRDPRLGRSIMPHYEPPDGIRPAEVGALVDGRVDQRDVAALLVDLAVRGYLRIEETREDGWLFDTTSYTFHRTKDPSAWERLLPFERTMLRGLFGRQRASVKVEELKNRFYTSLGLIRDQLYAALDERGYVRFRPDRVRTGMTGALVFVAVGSAIAANLAMGALGAHLLAAFGAALVAIVVAFVFGRLMPALTRKGAEARFHVLGFEEYLSRAERDRLKLATPETFERFLPYAMALGVEEQWARAFEGIYTRPPEWYAGASPPGRFTASSFTRSLGSMTSSAASTFASSPRSSSGSSGSGGGGRSGGGSGGGGGGAF